MEHILLVIGLMIAGFGLGLIVPLAITPLIGSLLMIIGILLALLGIVIQ